MGLRKYLLFSSVLALWTFSFSEKALAVEPNALPSGGNVKGGNVDFDYSSANELHVHQNSERAYIEWDSFNIGADALTQFHQTSSNAIAVNKVVSAGIDPTQILGTLNANGRVVVLDQNGIIFGKNATIDVGGIVASTGNIDAGAFMSGQNYFDITNIDTGGAIINEATITIAESGLAAFVAPTIVNEGIITARLGKVALAAGDRVTLDLYGDGLIEIAADDALTNALIEQSGSIHADGGFVQITAAAAKHSVDNLINMDGIITANAVEEHDGKIILGGGNIRVAGHIEANGDAGGGEILIGGDYQGIGDVPTAHNTLITQSATLSASAKDSGDGGKIIVWADENTAFYGTIEAQGAVDGTGGFVEVSGKSYLDYNGDVNLNGGAGLGTLLLDPDDIDIVAGTANPAEFADDMIALAENSGGTSTIGADTISGRLTANANVILQANNTIDVDAAITSTGTGDLTLETGAGGTINVNQAIDIDGAFTADASTGSINLGADITAEGITLNSTANVTGGTRTLDAGFGTMDIDAINAGAHQLSLRAGDFDLSGNLIGTDRLFFVGPRAGWSLGIGDSEIGSTQADLSDAELDFIQDGFNEIRFLFSWGGSSMHVGARAWLDNVAFHTNARDVFINGVQNVGANNLSIVASNNTHINADLIGTGTLSFTAGNIGTDAGASGLSDAELAHIIDGWNSIFIQNTNITIDTDGYQFSDPVSLFMSVGATRGTLNINDNIAFAAGSDASFTAYSADTINVNADIDLSAGDGTGGITFQDTDNLIIGGYLSTAGGNITINNDVLNTSLSTASTFDAGIGIISLGTGGINAGAHELSLQAGDFNLSGNLTGTNRLSFLGPRAPWSLGIGDSEIGSTQADLSDAELDLIQDGFDQINFSFAWGGSSIDVGARTWLDDLRLSTNTRDLRINGTQNVGNNDLAIIASNNTQINADLIGSGVLQFIASEIGSGAGAGGLEDAELAHIIDGWERIEIRANDITVDTDGYEFSDEVLFNVNPGGTFSLNDNLVAAAASDADFTIKGFSSFDADTININADIDLSAGDGTGGITFQNTDNLIIGGDLSTAGGNITVNNDVLVTSLSAASIFDASTGTISLGTAGINAGAHNLTLRSDEIDIFGNLSGSGDIQLTSATNTQEIEIGSTDTSDLNLTATELGFLQNGWNSITIGSSTHEGDISITDNVSFSDNVFLTTENISDANFPGINVSGNITTTDNANLTISTDQGGNNFSWVGFETTGDLNIAGDLDISAVRRVNLLGTGSLIVGGNLTLNSTQSNQGQTVIENYTTVNIGGNASLLSDNSDSFIRNVGSFTTGGNLTMTGGSPAYAPTDQAPFIQNITNFNIGGNMVVNATDTAGDTRFNNVTTAIIQGDLTINGGDTGFTALDTDLTVNGNTTITSSAIDLQNTFTLTGNLDSSSTLTFLEGGQDGNMELGGTSAGYTWQMEASEIATIQDGFSSITFGSSSQTGDIYFSDDVSFSDDVIFRQDQTASSVSIDGDSNIMFTTTDGASAHFYNADRTASIWNLVSFNIAGDVLWDNFRTLQIKDSTFAGDVTATNIRNNFGLHSGNTASIGGDLNVYVDDQFILGNSNAAHLQVDGDIAIESSRILFYTGSTLSGNTDGSSNLTFLEAGENNDMEIGAALTGATWQMEDAEFATIQNGFNAVTFGSSAMTGDITIDSLDMSSKQFDVSMHANDINLVDNDGAVSFGLKKGLSNFSAFAYSHGADLGDITATNATIQSNNTGDINLYADHDILFTSTGIFATSNHVNVLFNADRDSDMDGGITLNNSDISTNGGYVVMGGGSGALGGINGILGDGDGTGADDSYAFRLTDAVYLRNDTDISTGAGNIFINGQGTGTGNFTRGVRFDFDGQSLQTTSGDIDIKGLVTTGTDNQNAVNITNTDITSVSGDISIYGEVLASSLDDNAGIRIVNTNPIQTTSGDITLTGIVNGSGNNSGIYFLNQTNVLMNGAGTLTLNATGTGSYDAISGNSGLGMIGGASASGNIIFNTNSIDLTKTVQTSGNVSFVPQTDGISIGVSTSAGTLDLSDSELANIDAGKIIFGSESLVSSPLFVNSWDLNGKNYEVEFLAKQVSLNGLVLGSGDITARAEDIILNNPVNNNGQGGNMYLVATNQFTNNAGPGSIDPGSGRFLIYVDNQEQLEANGLKASRRFSSTFSSNPPNTILGANNLFIFAEDAPPVSNILQDTVQETINRINVRAKANIEPPNRSVPKSQNKEQSENLDIAPDTGTKSSPSNTNASVCLVAFKNASGCVL